MKRLVADTGPILHLHEAGALQLLPLIGEVLIPQLMVAELRVHAPTLWAGSLPEWAKLQTLSFENQQRTTQWQRAGLLHGGEAASLALAIETKPDWFLTDDAAARLVAESFGLEVHGSIGIVLWAAAHKLAGKAEIQRCLSGLEQSSLWMSRKVRAQARETVEKLFASD